jgi:hypothetical protein
MFDRGIATDVIVTDIASLVRPKYPVQSALGPIAGTITPLSHNALCCVRSKQTSSSGFVTSLALLHGIDSEITNLPKELWSFHRCGCNGCVVFSAAFDRDGEPPQPRLDIKLGYLSNGA